MCKFLQISQKLLKIKVVIYILTCPLFIQVCGSNFSVEIKSAIVSGHMFEGWLNYLKSSSSTFWLNAPVCVSVVSVLPLLSLAPQSGLCGQLRSQWSSIVWVRTLSNGFCGLGQSGPVITPENCGPCVLLLTKSHQPWLSTECSRLWGETYKKKISSGTIVIGSKVISIQSVDIITPKAGIDFYKFDLWFSHGRLHQRTRNSFSILSLIIERHLEKDTAIEEKKSPCW